MNKAWPVTPLSWDIHLHTMFIYSSVIHKNQMAFNVMAQNHARYFVILVTS